MMKILTVVIPAYNVEMYLRHTLNSFVVPEVLDDFEVIVVDDGSKDATAAIAMEFQKKYPQTFRVFSKENGGHGSGINQGIQLAEGKYFCVVDGDDWVNTPDFFKTVQFLKNRDEDVVMTNHYRVNDKTQDKKPVFSSGIIYNQIYHFNDISEICILGLSGMSIKTEILKNNKIHLDEHCYYVDMEYIAFPVPYIHSVAFLDLFVYMYRVARQGQSVSVAGVKKHLKDHDNVVFHLIEFLNQYSKAPEAEAEKIEYIAKLIANMISTQMTIYLNDSFFGGKIKQSLKNFDERIKSGSNLVYEKAASHKKVRLLRITHYRLYWLLSFMAKFYVKMGWLF